jgi:putative FmdB family regulatory protein
VDHARSRGLEGTSASGGISLHAMPIYECRCEACRITFEILAPVTAANRKRACPRCARPAGRVVSAFAIGAARGVEGRASASATAPAHENTGDALHHHAQHGRARRPAVPDFARLCWMDDRSAERFAAYQIGRGAEYDDKSAAVEEQRKQRGLPAPPAPDQTNSPVARMVARKKAEQAKKATASVKAGAPGTSQ